MTQRRRSKKTEVEPRRFGRRSFLLGAGAAACVGAGLWLRRKELSERDKTEKQQQKLLLGGGQDFIDPDIREKYGVKTFSKGNRIYTYKEKESVSDTGKVTTTKTEIKSPIFC